MGRVPFFLVAMTASSLFVASWGKVFARADRAGDQAAWTAANAVFYDQAADLLAGPLEYSWSSSGDRPLHHQEHQFSGASVASRLRLKDLESAFDLSRPRSRLEAASAKETRPLLGTSDNPFDCMAHVDAALDASFALQEEMTKILTTYPNLSPALGPLSKVIVIPSQDVDHQAMVTAMRSLEMGLIGFHHIVQYMSEQTGKAYLPTVVLRVETLHRRAEDVISCEDGYSFSDFTTPPSHPSCKAVQTFYDDYFVQAKATIAARMNVSGANKDLLKAALAMLHFQTAGAYLTHQGAQEVAEELAESDSSTDIQSVVEKMRLTIGAGDALQACQSSLQKGAIRMETRSDSVSDFEQLMYSYLAMDVRRQNPILRFESPASAAAADDQVYGGCQPQLKDAVGMVNSIKSDLETGSSQPTTGAKMAQGIVSRYVKQVKERLQRPVEDKTEIELRQLEMSMAILIRTIKDVSPTSSYSVMKQSLGSLQQLEVSIHNLYNCVLTSIPSTPRTASENSEDHAGSEWPTESFTEAMRCDFLAESYRESLAQSMKALESVSRKKGEDKATVAFLQTSIQGLAEAADAWDEDTDSAAQSGVANSWEAVLKEILVKSQSAKSKALQKLPESVPFMIAQANALQACSNVWRATHGTRRSEYSKDEDLGDEDLEDDSEDEDGEESEEDNSGEFEEDSEDSNGADRL